MKDEIQKRALDMSPRCSGSVSFEINLDALKPPRHCDVDECLNTGCGANKNGKCSSNDDVLRCYGAMTPNDKPNPRG